MGEKEIINGEVGVGWEGVGRDQKETQHPGEERVRGEEDEKLGEAVRRVTVVPEKGGQGACAHQGLRMKTGPWAW